MTYLNHDAGLLAAGPLLSALAEDEQRALLERLPRRHYPPRAVIARAGDNSRGPYMLLSGSAKVLMEDPKGRQVIVGTLRPGELFGEIDPLDLATHCATVVAASASEVLHIPTRELLACITRDPRAVLFIIGDLERRLRAAYIKVASLAFEDVRARVVQVLLEGSPAQTRRAIVPFGSEEIARVVGSSREMVSRVMRSMREAGLIRTLGRSTEILEWDALIAERTKLPLHGNARERRAERCYARKH
jgi:CRP/FNR family transcriptional regulator, cyclic AMP receptor protein